MSFSSRNLSCSVIPNLSSQQNIAAYSSKEIFEVDHVDIPLQVPHSIRRKVIFALSSIATLGLVPLAAYGASKLIPTIILPALFAEEKRKIFCKELKQGYLRGYCHREFDLKTKDGTVVNGVVLLRDDHTKEAFVAKKAGDQKWIVRFNGNNEFYEDNLEGTKKFADSVEANILVFNYRGVGDSQRSPTKPEDLIMDGEACIQYLLSKGVKEENILIHGLSLGGGIGSQVASLHEKIALVNERSFSTLTTVASALTNSSLAKSLLLSFGWELDSVKAYEKIKAAKLVVYHKQDAVMPYLKASLYNALKEQFKEKNAGVKPLKVKLQRKFQRLTSDAHNYSLLKDEAYPQIQSFMKKFFNTKIDVQE